MKNQVNDLNMNTVYGNATDSLGNVMTVTGALFNSNGTLLLKGYVTEHTFDWVTLTPEMNYLSVLQGAFDVESCDYLVEKLILEMETLKDKDMSDIVPVILDNSGYSTYCTVMTIKEYLEAKEDAKQGWCEPIYIATIEEVQSSLIGCGSELDYYEYLEQKERLQGILELLKGNNVELEYNIRYDYIRSIWLNFELQDYYSTPVKQDKDFVISNEIAELDDDLPF